jgi:hypothetical protein
LKQKDFVKLVPDRLNQVKFISHRSGIYFGQSTEICGANHRFFLSEIGMLLLVMYRVRMERGVCVQTPVASVLTRPTSAVKPVNVTSKVRIS